MNQNPNEYNPYATPPSGPNYPPTPNSGYGGSPSGPNYPLTPNAGYGGPSSGPAYPPVPNSGYSGPPSGPGYLDPTVPTTDPAASPYGSYPPPPNPVAVPPTSYGAYSDQYAPPPPATPNYGTPAYAPMPPATPPSKPSRGRTGLIVAIVLLVIVVGSVIGVVAYNNNQTTIHNNNATATAQTALAQAQANATSTAGSFATATSVASTFPFFPHLVLNDPMTSNSNAAKYGWESNKFCYFSGNAYQVLDDQKNTYGPCAGLHTSFTDYTFQVDATMKQGDNQSAAGLYFRANEAKNQGYIFTVDQQGGYSLWIATDATANNSRTLKNGNVSNFTAGLGQTNTIAAVVRGSQIALYVNQQLVVTIQDSTYSGGEIGFISSNTDATTIMSYNNVKVWTA